MTSTYELITNKANQEFRRKHEKNTPKIDFKTLSKSYVMLRKIIV